MLMHKKIKGAFLCIIMTAFFMILVFSGSAYAEETVIYCSPDGTESGHGTESSPVDLLTAISMAKPGASIYLLDGTYSYDSQITIEADISGTEENKIKLFAVNAGKVTLDFSAETYAGTNNNDRGLQINADYWHIYGIRFYNAADNGVFVAGSNNIIENCVLEANRDTGLQISRATSSTPKSQWPANNLILNCTSFNNMDATGENADGFAAKLTCGDGNVFNGCIAYNNVDDGWDLYTKKATGAIGTVTLVNCIAFRNGQTTDGNFTAEADGNGFKLGGDSIGVNHVVINCIAFENKNHGFTDNSNPGIITLINCTSFNNSLENGKKSNFDFARQYTSNNYFENLLSFSTNSITADKYRGTGLNCVFYGGSEQYLNIKDICLIDTKLNTNHSGDDYENRVTAEDFVSIESPLVSDDIHSMWRNDDGTVNTKGFLALAEESSLASMGTSSSPLGSTLGNGISMEPQNAKNADDLLEFEVETSTKEALTQEENDTTNPVSDENASNDANTTNNSYITLLLVAVSCMLSVVAIIIIVIAQSKKNHKK